MRLDVRLNFAIISLSVNIRSPDVPQRRFLKSRGKRTDPQNQILPGLNLIVVLIQNNCRTSLLIMKMTVGNYFA